MQKIFVYGTLLKDCRNYRKYLENHVGHIQSAYVRGTLYSIKNKDYPEAIKQYTGNIILVAINYDKKSKNHECIIEKLSVN